MITPYKYQMDAINAVRDCYSSGKKSPLLVLPTGGGKTICFSYITQLTQNKGNKVLILVHRIELLEQASEKFSKFGIRHGLINKDYSPDYNKTVQIATVGTYVKRLDKFSPDLIIIDEAHHSCAGTWKKIIDEYPSAYRLGVTATPCRSDGKGLDNMFDSIVIGPQPRELMEMGFLVPPVIYFGEVSVDVSKVDISKKGDYNEEQLKEIIGGSKIIGDSVRLYKKLSGGAPAIAFCINVEEANKTAEEFRRAGYRAEAVSGNMKKTDRKRILNGLADGSLDIVTSCDVISEGTDIPGATVAILLRPTASLGLFLQQCGRVLRTAPGKTNAIILDHVGNVGRSVNGVFYENHGRPHKYRYWSLEEGVKKKANSKTPIILDRRCDSCGFIVDAAPVCSECGAELKKSARELEIEEGELKRLEEDAIVVQKKEERKKQGETKTIEELFNLARSRRYSDGWVYNVFLSKVNKKIERLVKKNMEDSKIISLINLEFEIMLLDLRSESIKAVIRREWEKHKNK